MPDTEALRAAAEKATLYVAWRDRHAAAEILSLDWHHAQKERVLARMAFQQSLDCLGLYGASLEPLAYLLSRFASILADRDRLLAVAEAAEGVLGAVDLTIGDQWRPLEKLRAALKEHADAP